MKYKFRDYKIQRTCNKKYADYHSYKAALENDFNHRCAYCNLLDSMITTPFEVDHFVPYDAFKNVWPELETTYDNLIYSCKKCNRAKSNKYAGDLTKKKIENELFYKPDQKDYTDIFYRNDEGGICSDDDLGNEMIVNLKLYSPIHNLAWICERLKSASERLDTKIKMEAVDSDARKKLEEARNELKSYYTDCLETFIANYNNKSFS
jgi:5-methylcytosine-specific restriction endonuclease McrA